MIARPPAEILRLIAPILLVAFLSACDSGAPTAAKPVLTATQQPASFHPLGVLSGDVRSYAFGLSASGNAVVGASYDAQDIGEAFRWTESAGMVGLGSLPDRPNSQANA